MDKDEDITFVCVKCDPDMRTCQVRKMNTGIEQALITKCREVESLISYAKKPRCEPGDDIIVRDFALHGMTEGGVVLGHVKFTYYGQENFTFCTTAFTIDLNKAFDLHEPAASFAAISFPLEEDMLDEKPNQSGFAPYYKSYENGVALSGLVSFEGEINPTSATIHSFETALEWGS